MVYPFNVQWRYSKKLDQKTRLQNRKHKNQVVNILQHVGLNKQVFEHGSMYKPQGITE